MVATDPSMASPLFSEFKIYALQQNGYNFLLVTWKQILVVLNILK